MLRRVRQVVQALSLIAFLVLLTLTRYEGSDELAYPVRLFLDIDPLVMLSTLLSAHTVPAAFLASLAVLGATLVLGRAFCSWICPLGTLNQLAGRWVKRRADRERAVHRGSPAQGVKYGVLVGVLVASAFGLQWAGIVDPISLSIRSLGLAIGPSLELASRSVFDALYNTGAEPVRAISEPVYGVAKQTVLSFEQPTFRQAPLLGVLLLAILLLNVLRPRFWCRFVCPLGALLGAVARLGMLRLEHGGDCDHCQLCTIRCPGGADPDRVADGKWRPAECYVCGNCTSQCKRGLAFRFGRPRLAGAPKPVTGIDAGRRTVLAGGAAGLIAVPLTKVPLVRELPDPALIRPPGSLPEREFLSRCVRCGECMKVCITNGLQPTALEAGLEGIWTPVLVPRIGYCEYNCTLCGQVCPTGAIESLTVERKRQVHIGTAFVDPERCLPIALGIECVVCEEHCPTPDKAIVMVEIEALGPDGTPRRAHRPVVNPDLCIGCGICETRCPVRDLPAIRITSIGESRNPDNPLLLGGGGSGYGYY